MVLRLALNVVVHALHHARAHGEDRVALLPRELAFATLACPYGSRFFQLARKVRNAVRRLEPEESVDVVFDSPDLECHAAQATHCAAEILEKTPPPLGPHERAAIFGRANP